MPQPEDPAEHALVLLAIQLAARFEGYCEWESKAEKRLRDNPPIDGLAPRGIQRLLLEHVLAKSGEIIQISEKREEYKSRNYYYKAIIPTEEIELFVELILVDDDPKDPTIKIVNAHLQGR